jgi:4-amino-4-deoxy-L-arabinose transferase-like glycosyltransferase
LRPATLVLLAAGALTTLAAVIASIVRLLSSAPSPLPSPVLAVGPLLLSIGFVALWAGNRAANESHPLGRLVGWLPQSVRARGVAHGELIVLTAVVLIFILVVARQIAIGGIFGFDESIYALTARSWLEGTPNTGWSSHRSPGISVLGIAALPFGMLEAPFRSIGLLFGSVSIVACWRLARELAGPAAGLIAALAVATIPDLQRNAAAFLTDVPSAALVVIMMLLVWRRFESGSVPGAGDRRLLLIAFLAAVTFYIRYGASVPIAFLVLTVVILWPGRIIADWRMIVAAVALLFVLLAPHLVYATSLGSPWAVALSARNLAAPDYPGQALQVYMGQFPSTVAGPIAGAVAICGICAAIWRLARGRRIDRRMKAYLFLLLPALGAGLLLGIVALAQTRYVYVPLMLLVIAGSVALAGAWRRLPALLRAGSGVTALAVVMLAMLNVGSSMVAAQSASALAQRDVIVAAHRIRADALSRTPAKHPHCSVLAYHVPQLTWYSECAVFHFGYPAEAGRQALLFGPNRYLMLMDEQTIRQPDGAMLEGYLRLVDPQPMTVVRDLPSGAVAARIYRFVGP